MSDYSILKRLEEIVDSRRNADPSSSYVAKQFGKGTSKIAQKVGEEGVEVALAVVAGTREEVIYESADLLFHLVIALSARGVSLEEVCHELATREHKTGLSA